MTITPGSAGIELLAMMRLIPSVDISAPAYAGASRTIVKTVIIAKLKILLSPLIIDQSKHPIECQIPRVA